MAVFSDAWIDRTSTDSVKWKVPKKIYRRDDLLPMWVADMDFLSPKEITEALIKRAEHGIYGYAAPPGSLFSTIRLWLEKRFHWTVPEDSILLGPGVVSSLALAIRALTDAGDKILIQSPVYHPFYQVIKNNGRELAVNPLVYDGNAYTIDFDDLERKLKNGVKAFLLCSPHNPVGRVWKRDELEAIGALCEKYGVYILSDEIHADIVYEPNRHLPIASLHPAWERQSITFMAPSKTFNIPGLQASFMVIADRDIRKKVKREQQKIAFHGPNLFANIAMEAAYQHGEKWLEELLSYLKENVRMSIEFLKTELPAVRPVVPEGTYLLWLDCRELQLPEEQLMKALIEKGKILLEPGKKFGEEGDGFLRMNIACPRPMLEEGLQRFKRAFS